MSAGGDGDAGSAKGTHQPAGGSGWGLAAERARPAVAAGRWLRCPRCFRLCGERTVRGTVYIVAERGVVELELMGGTILRRCPGNGHRGSHHCAAVIRLDVPTASTAPSPPFSPRPGP